jgi:hypothetical protein
VTTPVDLRSTQVLWRLALGLSVAYALALVLPIPLFDPDEAARRDRPRNGRAR